MCEPFRLRHKIPWVTVHSAYVPTTPAHAKSDGAKCVPASGFARAAAPCLRHKRPTVLGWPLLTQFVDGRTSAPRTSRPR
jgi:hypothetical protein